MSQHFRHPFLSLVLGLGLLALSGNVAPAVADDRPKPPARSGAEENDWTFEATLQPQYVQGSFGTGHTTRILYTPFSTQWSPTDELDLRLTVPFVWERGRTIFASVGGDIAGAQRVDVQRRKPRATSVIVGGIGDLLLEVAYALTVDHDSVPEVAPFVQVKFPTADSARGLGTGEFDETIGVALTKRVGRWTGIVDVDYTLVGSPPQRRLDNIVGWSVGAAYEPTRSFKLAVFVDGATAAARETNPVEARLETEYKVSKTASIVGGASVGLTRSAADFGFSYGLRIRF